MFVKKFITPIRGHMGSTGCILQNLAEVVGDLATFQLLFYECYEFGHSTQSTAFPFLNSRK